MPYSWTDLILYFFIYSFCGWLLETVLCSVKEKRLINRGFLNGPICPIYGCGVLLMLVLLIPVRDSGIPLAIALPVVFLAGAALASMVEYVASWAMERLFHARWWDYSHYRFNVHGRVCLWVSLAWGALASAFLYLVQPLFEALVAALYRAGGWAPHVLAAALLTLFVADTVVSARVAHAIGNKLEQMDKWGAMIRAYLDSLELPSKEAVVRRIEEAYERIHPHGVQKTAELLADWRVLPESTLRRRLADAAEELKKRRDGLMESTRALQRRMLHAFPHLERRGRHADGSASHDLRAYLKTRPAGAGEDRSGLETMDDEKTTPDAPRR